MLLVDSICQDSERQIPAVKGERCQLAPRAGRAAKSCTAVCRGEKTRNRLAKIGKVPPERREHHMLSESADCPLCKAAAERTRARGERDYTYTCPSCRSFNVSPSALSCAQRLPMTVRDEVHRLLAFGYLPKIEADSQTAIRVVPGRE